MIVVQKQNILSMQTAKVTTTVHSSWGWFPQITLLHAFGLLLTALAYTLNRNAENGAAALFWLSLIVIFAPSALRISMPNISRKERIGLVMGTGIALYLVKILFAPLDFTYHDEFLHWRTATDMMLTGRLFTQNPILTVSPLYPGLEVITTAFANLSGLSIVEAGMITLGVIRLMFTLALFLFYEQVGQSPYIAGIASLLYMGNSNFLYFDSQFSYESLSLPLATAVLYIVMLQQRAQGRGFVRLLLLVLPIILTIAITHHLTAYVLAGFLFVWSVVAIILRRTRRQSINLAVFAALTVAIVAGWTAYTGNVAEDYLLPVIGGGITEFMKLLLNEETGRELFRGAAGLVTPLWERIIGILSVACIMVVLPFGLLEIWRSPFKNFSKTRGVRILKASMLQAWHRYRNNPVAVMFAGLVFVHPIMLGFRFTSNGWEIANRSSEFVFWAIAFILAIGAIGLRRYAIPTQVWTAGFVVWLTIIFLGGSISGWPPWARLPGSYLVSADTRSIEPQSIAAATWSGEYLDEQDRIAADRINTLLLATYGHMLPVTHQYDDLYILPVFFSEQIGPVEIDLIQRTNLRYVLVDDRLSTALPTVGVYFEAGEQGANQHTKPPSREVLAKFSTMPSVSLIFDSGHIKIYDVSVFNEPVS